MKGCLGMGMGEREKNKILFDVIFILEMKMFIVYVG